MDRWQLRPATYRTICVVAMSLVCLAVVTGAAVRLTGSGLGCDDWPRCSDSKVVDVSTGHAAIEQINRLLTGLISLVVIAAVLAARWRAPRRRDLTVLSYGLVAGVLGQIVLGGITVLVDLHPAAVQAHFVLSMVLVAVAVVLVVRAGRPDGVAGISASRSIRRHVDALVAATGLAIVLGTVVTGAGPHAGDEDARRFGISISNAARIHSVAVWIAVAVALALGIRLSRRAADRRILDAPLTAWVAVALLQAAVGYVQYFNDIPSLLVGLHVAGATALWTVSVWLWCCARTARDERSAEVADELRTLVDHA